MFRVEVSPSLQHHSTLRDSGHFHGDCIFRAQVLSHVSANLKGRHFEKGKVGPGKRAKISLWIGVPGMLDSGPGFGDVETSDNNFFESDAQKGQ